MNIRPPQTSSVPTAGRLETAMPLRESAAGSQRARAGAALHAPSLQLSNLVSQLATQPAPVDVSRVIDLQTAIADGSYRFDADRTANAMLRSGKDG